MNSLRYQHANLHMEEVSVSDLAQTYDTPLYCMSQQVIESNYQTLDYLLEGTDHQICYSVKANGSLAVLQTLANIGSGADVVSEGELRLSLKAGIDPKKIVFSGVGKSIQELQYAVQSQICMINVESKEELQSLIAIGENTNRDIPIALRINPEITNTATQDLLSTGRPGDKFGIAISDLQELGSAILQSKHIQLVGLDMHIGSKISSLDPFREAFQVLKQAALQLEHQGFQIQYLDLGGGIPDDPIEYADLIKHTFHDLSCKIILEPGRYMVADAGILIAKVISKKKVLDKNILIVDAGMNDLIRPALYDAVHIPIPVYQSTDTETCDIVGPVCEPGDQFCKDITMPKMQSGDLLAFQDTGAYGAAMASEYNARPRIAEVMVSGSKHALTRKRATYQEILDREIQPFWMQKDDCDYPVLDHRDKKFITFWILEGKRLESFHALRRFLHPDREESQEYEALILKLMKRMRVKPSQQNAPNVPVGNTNVHTGENEVYIRVDKTITRII